MRKIFKLIKILIIIFVILIIIVTLCDEEETTSVDTTGMDMTAEKNTGIQGEKTDIAVEQDPSKVQDIYGAIDDYLNNNKDSGALKKIKTGDKESVWKYLTEKIMDEVNDNYSDSLIRSRIYDCKELYVNAFSESRQELDRCVELADQLIQLTKQQEEIDEKYPFTISQAAANIQHDRLYVAQRLETSYSDNILGNIQKEIDSYMSENDSDWVAYNVYSDMGADIPGDDCYVLHSTQLNPFSYSGSYELTFYYSSETMTLQNESGFSFEAPVLYLIDNEDQLYEDCESYQNAETQHESLINEIIEINSGTASEPAA